MKIKDLIKMEIDVDMYDDYTDELNIAFVGPLTLTEEGQKFFNDVLDFDVDLYETDGYATVRIDSHDMDWDQHLEHAKRFFHAAAGYCSEENYNKWFKEED